MKKTDFRTLSLDLLVDVLGGVLIALGTYNFAAAADFPMVGVNGIALIFYHLSGSPIGLTALLLNIPIAAICFRILGRAFFLRSVRTIIVTSLIMDYIAPLFPVYTGDRLLAALCTGILSGLGYAFIYMRESSTGGADFIILSVKAKRPHLSVGKITFVVDIAVVLAGTAAISRDIDGLIYGAVVTFLLSMVVDKVMYGTNAGKLALIVTGKPQEVAREINDTSGRGATFLDARGSFTDEEKSVVMCACNSKQMYPIQKTVQSTDPSAVIIRLESNEVLGKGFKN